MGARLLRGSPSRREIHLHDAVSRLFEESADLDLRYVGQTRESTLGWRSHQALESVHADTAPTRNGVLEHPVPRGRSRAVHLDDNGLCSESTGISKKLKSRKVKSGNYFDGFSIRAFQNLSASAFQNATSAFPFRLHPFYFSSNGSPKR